MALLVLISIIFVSGLFYDGIEDRVKALRGSATLLSKTISNPSDPKSSIEYWVDRGFNYSQYLNTELQLAPTFQYVNRTNVNSYQQSLQGYTSQSMYFSNMAYSIAMRLCEREKILREEGIVAKGTSFEDLYSITCDLVNTTQQMNLTLNELLSATTTANNAGGVDIGNMRTKGIELTNHYYKAKALIKAAVATLPAGDVNILAPFILITVIFALFLLFPWILLLLFFLRKKTYLIATKLRTFEDLNLIEKVFADLKKTRNRSLQTLSEGPKENLSFSHDENEPETKKLEYVRKEIDDRGFRISEYVISLVLLTFISSALLYFFFYPNATAGLADHISSGGGVKAFADYLANDATPLTFGFIGAYFFVIHMLLRRYFAADLNPNAYSYATVRIFTVFILSTFLQLATTHFDWPIFVASAVAFVVGIFPNEGLRWILRTTNKFVSNLKAPEQIDQCQLIELDGLNNWHEARLLEENIENIQNLATASLDDLIINTNFCSEQLVDWIDQALLYVYVQDPWRGVLHNIGIRTATDLLENACGKKQDDSTNAERLVKAINDVKLIDPMSSEQSQKKLKEVSVPYPMTREILMSMVTSLKQSPNLSKLQKFRETRSK